jgi:hypothetical protein
MKFVNGGTTRFLQTYPTGIRDSKSNDGENGVVTSFSLLDCTLQRMTVIPGSRIASVAI